jgi:hypothetical protein
MPRRLLFRTAFRGSALVISIAHHSNRKLQCHARRKAEKLEGWMI